MDGGIFYQSAWQHPPAAKLTAVFLALQEVSYRVHDASDEVYYPEPEEYPYQRSGMSTAVKILLAATTPAVPYHITVRALDAQVALHYDDDDTDPYYMTYRQPRRISAALLEPVVTPPGPTGGFFHRRRFGSLRS